MSIVVTSTTPLATTDVSFADALEAYHNGAIVAMKLYDTIILGAQIYYLVGVTENDEAALMDFNGIFFCDDGNIYAGLPTEYYEAFDGTGTIK